MRYFIPDDGEGPEDARELLRGGASVGYSKSCWGDLFAQEAAEYVFGQCDGWDRKWPVVFGVVCDDGIVYYEVKMEAEPQFYAYQCVAPVEASK